MDKKKNIIIGVGVVALVIIGVWYFSLNKGNDKPINSPKPTQKAQDVTVTQKPNEKSTTQSVQVTSQPATQQKVKPTFMYFVAKSDANYSQAIAVAKELEAEYGDRVKFDVQDVDANPELKQRYMIEQPDSPMQMKTPTLIMLDVNNNISTIGLSNCIDKQTLKDSIEKALNVQ